MNNTLLTIPQAAKLCSLSRGTLWKYAKRGELRTSLTPGGQYRVHPQDLESFMGETGMHPLSTSGSDENRILIVDDDQAVRALFAKALRRRGYKAAVARDGFEAGIKVMTFRPKLVLLDLFMPGMNGFDVCRHIKADAGTALIKVLFITGFDSPQQREKALKAGADGYMVKPVQAEPLVEQVETLLNRTRGDSSSKTVAV
ncbi:MAG: response regulator [Deltaproteobacteria bacterium]|nr:response regulator [Deltaproteobacteria bacterium]